MHAIDTYLLEMVERLEAAKGRSARADALAPQLRRVVDKIRAAKVPDVAVWEEFVAVMRQLDEAGRASAAN